MALVVITPGTDEEEARDTVMRAEVCGCGAVWTDVLGQ